MRRWCRQKKIKNFAKKWHWWLFKQGDDIISSLSGVMELHLGMEVRIYVELCRFMWNFKKLSWLDLYHQGVLLKTLSQLFSFPLSSPPFSFASLSIWPPGQLSFSSFSLSLSPFSFFAYSYCDHFVTVTRFWLERKSWELIVNRTVDWFKSSSRFRSKPSLILVLFCFCPCIEATMTCPHSTTPLPLLLQFPLSQIQPVGIF